MAKTKKRISTRMKIIGGTLTALFSLFSLFSGTLAWFASSSSVTATGATITVKAPEGVNFDLYYLHHFVVNESTKDGNYNSIASIFSGYESTSTNAVFEKVLFDEDGVVVDSQGDAVDNEDNPTMINQLWPAHRLTYAIVITGGDVSKFSLTSWDEETDTNIKTTNNDLVSLSWAINMYGSAQTVTSTNNVLNDISTGFASYAAATLTDRFNYSQASPAPAQHTSIDILPTITCGQENQRTIIYFSIEFSDDSDTFYALDNITNGVSYYSKDTSGNSNCYEKLSLKDLVFKLL